MSYEQSKEYAVILKGLIKVIILVISYSLGFSSFIL